MDNVLHDLIHSIEDKFKLRIYHSIPIHKGLLNLKWKLITDHGTYFVKQYHPKRYPRTKLISVKQALVIQNQLQHQGIKCPQLYTNNDQFLINTNHNTYILTNYLEGTTLSPGSINEHQAYHLGLETARMHLLLSQVKIEQFTQQWNLPTKTQLLAQFESHFQQVINIEPNNTVLFQILNKQREILTNLDFTMFNHLKAGLAHSDLWCDNVLFQNDNLTAILDFDRLQLIYPLFDVARSLLSFFLHQNHLKQVDLQAYLNGYNTYLPLSKHDLVLSLKALYLLESIIWIGGKIEIDNGPPSRFKEEMIWLTNHWYHLENIICENESF